MTKLIENQAVVISASRRFASLCLDSDQLIAAKTSAKTLDVAVGDVVLFEARDGDNFINKILPRKNELVRAYRGETKTMAANLDLVIIVTAVGSGFNTIFVDKLLCYCFCQDIPAVLILNKIDQGINDSEDMLKIYTSLGVSVLNISAKYGQGLDELKLLIEQPRFSAIALVGISGVGKSTLINRFVPDAKTRTQEINARTGLGRQTTTQAVAHYYQKPDKSSLYLVDLPGLQSFGVSHLEKKLIAESFKEFSQFSVNCGFERDCSHIKENDCGIKKAVASGEISQSRYRSYSKILQEIEDGESY